MTFTCSQNILQAKNGFSLFWSHSVSYNICSSYFFCSLLTELCFHFPRVVFKSALLSCSMKCSIISASFRFITSEGSNSQTHYNRHQCRNKLTVIYIFLNSDENVHIHLILHCLFLKVDEICVTLAWKYLVFKRFSNLFIYFDYRTAHLNTDFQCHAIFF